MVQIGCLTHTPHASHTPDFIEIYKGCGGIYFYLLGCVSFFLGVGGGSSGGRPGESGESGESKTQTPHKKQNPRKVVKVTLLTLLASIRARFCERTGHLWADRESAKWLLTAGLRGHSRGILHTNFWAANIVQIGCLTHTPHTHTHTRALDPH